MGADPADPDAYFLSGTLEAIQAHHAAVGWLEQPACPLADPDVGPRVPRLETVLGVVARIYGDQSVDESVADAAAAEPNRLHHFLAQHLAQGGRHLTANFDKCVESAAHVRDLVWHEQELLHFHGAIGGKGELGATLARIEKGFPPGLGRDFLALFAKRLVVLVLGYSGSDFFDVNVTIAALPPESLRGLRVVWLQHSGHQPHVVPHDDDDDDADNPTPSVSETLHRKGADVTILCGPTEFLLRHLGGQWGFAPLGDPTIRHPTPPAISVADDLRPVATLALYLEIGLFDEIAPLLQTPPPRAPEDLVRSATSAALWEAGRWSDVRRMWSRVRPQSDDTRIERIGASLWVQGRFVPAFLWLTWHRRRARGDAKRVLAETEGRVLEHMMRTPELRWLARRMVPGVLAALGTSEQTYGVHLYRRRADLASSLNVGIGETREQHHALTSSEWFGQAGNVLAWITYRHRQLRDSYH